MSPEKWILFPTVNELVLSGHIQLNSKIEYDISEVHPERRLRGPAKSFNTQMGYGFINVSGFHEDIFVYYTANDDIPRGQAFAKPDEFIEFQVIETNRGLQPRKSVNAKSQCISVEQ